MRKRPHRITIQERLDVQDATTGRPTTTWTTVAAPWALVTPATAREFIAAQQTQSKITAKVVIDKLEGVDPSMRILFGAHVYNIEAVLEDHEKWEITLPVSEVVAG